jgi:hypothetical protein
MLSYPGGLKKAIVPGSVKKIDCAFYYSQKIKTVTIKEGVKKIHYAFIGCKSLKTIRLPKGLNKISDSLNECYKLNIGKFYKGENNHNWNHDLTESERINKRRYPAYYEWRNSVYNRDKYTCQCCGSNKSGNLVAHHIINYSSNKKLRLDINNGITFCVDCHRKFHNEFGYFNNDKEQLDKFINRN